MAFREQKNDRTVEYLEPSDLMRGLLSKPANTTDHTSGLAKLLDKPAVIPDRTIQPKTELEFCMCGTQDPVTGKMPCGKDSAFAISKAF